MSSSKQFTRQKTIAKNQIGTPGSGTVTSVAISSVDSSVTINSGSPVTGAGSIDLSVAVPPVNNITNAAPTVNADANAGYSVQSWWLNTITSFLYICTDSTNGAAVWIKVLT